MGNTIMGGQPRWADRLVNLLVLSVIAAGIHGFAKVIDSTLVVALFGYVISLSCGGVVVLAKPKNHFIEKLAIQISGLGALVALPTLVYLFELVFISC